MVPWLRNESQQKPLFHIIHEDDIELLNTPMLSGFTYYTIFDGKDTGNLEHTIMMRCMNLTRDKPGSEKKESMARGKES